jgi:hypothetical protein
MARKYNPAKSTTIVTDRLLAAAGDRLDAARVTLREVEQADPTQSSWDGQYDAAASAVRACERRVAALTDLRAAQLERGGKRDQVVQESAGELSQMAAGLGSSRDALAAALAEHLPALAAVVTAADAHNRGLAAAAARMGELGLRVRDDLVDEAAGQEHAEGLLDYAVRRGVRCGGVDWIPVDPAGVVAHALREAFASYGRGHPMADMGRYAYRPFEVEARADGLAVPVLKDPPPGPKRPAQARMTPLEQVHPPDRTPDPITGLWREPKSERRRGLVGAG